MDLLGLVGPVVLAAQSLFHHLPAVVDVYPAFLGPGDRAAFEVVVFGVLGFHLYGTDACRGTYFPDAAPEDLL